MNYFPQIDFSIIIPHYDSFDLLKRAVASIPDCEGIEVIVVDNGPHKISECVLGSYRKNVRILYSEIGKGAGRARNVGIQNSKGKWLLFLDADDFFTPNAFDTFYSLVGSDYDLVYFKMNSVYSDTLEPATRGDIYNQLIEDFLRKQKSAEDRIRLDFVSPCAKMVNRDFVIHHGILFEEIYAGNDVMFSTRIGWFAKSIAAKAEYVYCATVVHGSLTNESSFRNLESRYFASLRRNEFLRNHGKHEFQWSVMWFILSSNSYGFKRVLNFLMKALEYRNNIFIGYRNWPKTFFLLKDRRDV